MSEQIEAARVKFDPLKSKGQPNQKTKKGNEKNKRKERTASNELDGRIFLILYNEMKQYKNIVNWANAL